MTMKMRFFYTILLTAAGISFFSTRSCTGTGEHRLLFTDYPEMKIGFSTKNFMEALPFNAGSISELVTYAAEEGYQFIEIRDDTVSLTKTDCESIAEIASHKGIEVIYEINVSILDPCFPELFEKALDNTGTFGHPGILRAIVIPVRFAGNPATTGWDMEELKEAAIAADRYAKAAGEKGITFIVENLFEPFIGNPPLYYGMNDLFRHTRHVGLQFDLCNPFAGISRKMADPGKVGNFLDTIGGRWVTSHIKTCTDGVAQPVLGDNPITIIQLTELMGETGVHYFALELTGAAEKGVCFRNHDKSIRFLKELGIIEKR